MIGPRVGVHVAACDFPLGHDSILGTREPVSSHQACHCRPEFDIDDEGVGLNRRTDAV